MTFGEKVKKARNELGLTQTELGKMIGVSRRAITSYEADMTLPRRKDTYYKLADALKVYFLNLIVCERSEVRERHLHFAPQNETIQL